jgi:hypothetical protein
MIPQFLMEVPDQGAETWTAAKPTLPKGDPP